MTIDFVAYPWADFKRCFEKGILGESEHPDGLKMRAKAPAFSAEMGDSYSFYSDVCEALAMMPEDDFEGRDALKDFAEAFFAEELATDLDVSEQDDITVAVISPERIEQLNELAIILSVEALRIAFADEAPEPEFFEYLRAFCDFVTSVAGTERCLAIEVC